MVMGGVVAKFGFAGATTIGQTAIQRCATARNCARGVAIRARRRSPDAPPLRAVGD
jgi:hypothetical protein